MENKDALATQIRENPFGEGALRLLIPKQGKLAKGLLLDAETGMPSEAGRSVSTVFDMEHLLGRGDLTFVAIGEVSPGQLNAAESKVALKVFYPKPDLLGTADNRKVLLGQFNDEVKLLRLSEHSNITRFFGLTELQLGKANSKFPAIAREYFPNMVSEILRSGRSLSVNEVINLVTQVADGTNYLYTEHQRILMDITSENIGERIDRSYALTDINLSVLDGEELRPGNKLGLSEDVTPPELMASLESKVVATPRLAVYNLGVLAYELLGGSRPTREEKISGGLYLSELTSLSPQLNEVLRRATTKKFVERYSTITEYRNALASATI